MGFLPRVSIKRTEKTDHLFPPLISELMMKVTSKTVQNQETTLNPLSGSEFNTTALTAYQKTRSKKDSEPFPLKHVTIQF